MNSAYNNPVWSNASLTRALLITHALLVIHAPDSISVPLGNFQRPFRLVQLPYEMFNTNALGVL